MQKVAFRITKRHLLRSNMPSFATQYATNGKLPGSQRDARLCQDVPEKRPQHRTETKKTAGFKSLLFFLFLTQLAFEFWSAFFFGTFVDFAKFDVFFIKHFSDNGKHHRYKQGCHEG